MKKVDKKELLKLGKKHRKWLEETTVNLNAYKIGSHLFYLVHYESKFSTKVKANAVISPDSDDREEALQSIKPHIYFVISCNNLRESGSKRANLDYAVWEKIRNYLKQIVESNVLDGMNKIIYQRSLTIMQSMIDLQLDMIQLWENYTTLKEQVDQKGFFTDEEVEKVLDYVAKGNLIQYKQFRDRYDNCRDFDVIYENRDHPQIKLFEKNVDHMVLKGMTSDAAEQQLKDALDRLTKNRYFGNMNETEIYDELRKTYQEGLALRVQQTKDMLRYP
ncbi:hypothetical protein [Oceanobacillus damuensis]|uniref:hypothetical protein n=1 Tax=Oceanobacillus damuensis TaxID=937928 RepID=UPI000831E86E|nr:hypothetical protein [Oceanobacillus damuensis]